MMNKIKSNDSNLRLLEYLPKISLIAVALFITLLAVLHIIEPEFEPSKHLISEYELGRFGWLMSLAFFSLGIGVLSMVLSTWIYTKTKGSLIGKWIFLAISVALFGAGFFYPYIIPNTASKIHTLCGVIVIFAFPIAATLYYKGLTYSQTWIDSRKWILIATWIVWLGLITFFGSLIVFHPETANDKANMIVGWQNRFMMFTYSFWLMIVAVITILIKNRNK